MRFATAICLGALLVPTRIFAVDVSGSLDTGYLRTDSWSPGQPTVTVPTWDYGGAFSVSGSPLRPGLLVLDGGADYRKMQNYYSAAPSDNSNWGYHGNASLFTGSPLSLHLSANRGWADFTSQTNSPGVTPIQNTGSTFSRGEGVDALYRPDDRLPVLRASLGRNSGESSSFAQPVTTTENTYLSAGIGQTLDRHVYDLSYSTNWSSGTFADTNYRSHNLAFHDESHLANGLDFRVTENYFLRDPTTSATANPRIDDNSLMSGLQWRVSDPLQSAADYSYHRAVVDGPGIELRESLSHAIGMSGEYRYSSALSYTANSSVNYASERLGSGTYRGTGEQVGGGLRYSGKLGSREAWYASSSGSVGLLQAQGASGQGAYGLSGGAGISTRRTRWSGNVGYNVSYSKNLAARSGSSFNQGVNATAETQVGGARLQSSLVASATRYDDSLLGTNLARTASLSLLAQWRRESLAFIFGLSDGLSRTLTGGVVSDGLFLPAGYDTHSRFANATASFQLARNLSTSLLFRWAESSGPGRPDQYERGASLDVSYALGAFTLSGEERYSIGGQGGITQSGNAFYLRLSRSFGMKF